MKILLIHQYFLEKGDGGGSRFNEMTKAIKLVVFFENKLNTVITLN